MASITQQIADKAAELAKLAAADSKDTKAIVAAAREIDGLQKQAEKAQADLAVKAHASFVAHAIDSFAKVAPADALKLMPGCKAQLGYKLDPPNGPSIGFKLIEVSTPAALKQCADALAEGLEKVAGDHAALTVTYSIADNGDVLTDVVAGKAPRAAATGQHGGGGGQRGNAHGSGMSMVELVEQFGTAEQKATFAASSDRNVRWNISKAANKARLAAVQA